MSTSPDFSAEWQRLAAIPSVAGIVASQVSVFRQLPQDELPTWLNQLRIPTSWRIARYHRAVGHPVAPPGPSRTAVSTPTTNFRGGFGCETLTVFGFSGKPVAQVVQEQAGCSLYALGAVSVTESDLGTLGVADGIATRSSGYIVVGGINMWAQYSNYIVGSMTANKGRLVEHSLFVDAAYANQFGADIEQLSSAVHLSFFSAAATLLAGGPQSHSVGEAWH